MKKLIKWIISIVALLVILVLILALALPFVLPLERIKNFAAAKMEEALHREVRIGDVSFNIFSGIKLKDLYIGNRKGFSPQAFISAQAIELRYAFWPLLRLQLVIEKINLVKPQILVERKKGEYNFSDLIAKKPREVKKPPRKAPVNFFVSKFSISKGKLTMVDYTPVGPKERGFSNLDVDISQISLMGLKPMSIQARATGLYEGKSIPLRLSGDITLNLDKNSIKLANFSTSVAGEKILTNGEITNFRTAPNVNFSVTSNKVALDPFLAILSGQEKPAQPRPYGEATRSINRLLKSIPTNLVLNGSIDLHNLAYRTLKMDSLKLNASMRNKRANVDIQEISAYEGRLRGKGRIDLNVPGLAYSLDNLELKNFNAAPFTNALIDSFLTQLEKSEELKDKIQGRLELRASLKGQGVEVPDILANLKGSGSLLLTHGKAKHLKSMESIADKIGVKVLKEDLMLKELKGRFTIEGKILNIQDLLAHNDPVGEMRVTFKGGINLEKLEYVPGNELVLYLHPNVTKDLPPEYEYFKDEKGWTKIDFELKGPLKRPIPVPKLGKIMKRAVEKKVEEEKEKIKEEVKKEVEKKKEELREETEKKLKELIKF